MAKTADTIAIYSRKSRYTGKGESIGNQIDLCREYIRTHYGDAAAEHAVVFETRAFPCRKDAETQKAPGEPLGSSPGASPMHRYFTPVHNSYSISIRFGFTGRAFCC